MFCQNVDLSPLEFSPKALSFLARFSVDPRVEREEIPRESIHESRPGEAFQDEQRILIQGGIQLVQALRHPRAAIHSIEFTLQGFGCYGGRPEFFESGTCGMNPTGKFGRGA